VTSDASAFLTLVGLRWMGGADAAALEENTDDIEIEVSSPGADRIVRENPPPARKRCVPFSCSCRVHIPLTGRVATRS